MDNDFENEDDLEKEDKNKYFGRRVAITECICFAIFVMLLFSFVSCKREGYYTDFHFGIRIYKDFEKEVADTMTFYSSGSYSDNSSAIDTVEIPLPKCNLHVEDEVFLCKSFSFPGSMTIVLYALENQEELLKLLNDNNKKPFLLSLGDENDFSDLKLSDGIFDDLDNCYSYIYLVYLKEPVKELDIPIVSDFYIKSSQQ